MSLRITLVKREQPPLKYAVLAPIGSVVLALMASSIYVLLANGDLAQVYYFLLTWPLANPTEVFVTATPILLLALAVSIAFKAKFWNIGTHGQFIVGGLIAAWLGVQLSYLPSPILISIIMVSSWLAGSGVALISWYLKVTRNQDEVLTTILIWSAILLIVAGLLTGPMRSPFTTYPQSQEIGPNAKLPLLIPNTRLHLGVLIPFILVGALWVILKRTSFRNSIIAVTNPRFAELEGKNVARTYFWVAFLSGGISGLAGSVELMGILSYMTPFVGPNYGLIALAIAMVGNLDPIGVMASALFFSILINGANAMSWNTGVPSFLSDIIQAQTLIFLLLFNAFLLYKVKLVKSPAISYPIGSQNKGFNIQKTYKVTLNTSHWKDAKILRYFVIVAVTLIVIGSLQLLIPSLRESFVDIVLSSVLGLTLIIATPIAFAALGETITEKAGILNLGILGIMVAGAGWGFMGAYFFNSLLTGFVIALLVGASLSMILAILVVTLGTQQHIAGIAITFYAMNLTYFFHRLLIGAPLVEPKVPPSPNIVIPVLSDLPFIGALFQQNLYVYFGMYMLPIIVLFIFQKTRWGLVIKSVGENPKAADSARIRVHLTRYISVIIGGMLMAAGGAFYSLMDIRAFNLNVGGEWSWIALALVVLGNWNPLWVWAVTLFFGLLNAVQAWLVATVIQIPFQFFQAVPYVLTVGISAALGKRVRPPRALLYPYRRE
jgi:simple sugar transport system permease protein